MGKLVKKQFGKQSTALSAVDMVPGGVPSKPNQDGRKLILKFESADHPALDLIEFKACTGSKAEFRQRNSDEDRDRSFKHDKFPIAVSIFFLDYLCAQLQSPPRPFHMEGGNGTLAATLGNALAKNNSSWYKLFVEFINGEPANRVSFIFRGSKLPANPPEPRLIRVDSSYLPADCFEVYWCKVRLSGLDEIQRLADKFRECWKLPPPPELAISKGEASPPEGPLRQQEPLTGTGAVDPAKASPPGEPSPHPEVFKFATWFADKTFELLRGKPRAARKPKTDKPKAQPQAQAPTEAPQGKPQTEDISPKPDGQTEITVFETKTDPPKISKESVAVKKPEESEQPDPVDKPEKPQAVEYPPLPPIDPKHFRLVEETGSWPDEAPLVYLPKQEDEDGAYAWTLKNAFEGILIMGRTGSGKTSGSGFTFAESFVRAGFGGLVLTVKKNEARNWERLCAHCGRSNDIIVIRPRDIWRLNVLAYEAQHPGRGMGLAQNLTSFCRNLLRISSRSQGPSSNDYFWDNAGDQLLNATFDIFLLAGGGITFDRLSEFISAAPTENIPQTEDAWLKAPVFGNVLSQARKSIRSPEDQRIFNKARDYWCKVYPALSSKTRTSITLGIYAMLDAFRGRDIPDLISAETTITPEAIMNGMIVVIDLPLKEFGRTGLMVQSAWKYLFQTALERHDHARGPKRRPVFLWEDEAQYFFSDHDHHFQDTARSSRVSRVILTQNLHSFYKELGRDGIETADSVFGNLNTKVFHNNSDPQSNEWAAKHFGTELQTRYSFSHAPPPPPKDFLDGIRQSIDPPNRTTISSAQHWDYVVRPEQFNTLRTGGPENDFLVDAWITWMGLSAENDRHFTKITFAQNQNL